MSSPNIEGTTNPASTGGSSAGVKVGYSATETLGFYGATGVAKQSSTGVTTVAGLITLLTNLGLLS